MKEEVKKPRREIEVDPNTRILFLQNQITARESTLRNLQESYSNLESTYAKYKVTFDVGEENPLVKDRLVIEKLTGEIARLQSELAKLIFERDKPATIQ